jgi:glycosyltransferase involved in cell wall biosynthesis
MANGLLPAPAPEDAYNRACALVEGGEIEAARSAYRAIAGQDLPPRWRALVENDLGALEGVGGDVGAARAHFQLALAIDAACDVVRRNLATIETVEAASCRFRESEAHVGAAQTVGAPHDGRQATQSPLPPFVKGGRTKVAILSLLFSWPSTGGGTVHTAELGTFLSRAGYDVRHIYAQYAGWGVGNVAEPLPVAMEPLEFHAAHWNAPEIQRRFRESVDRFAPDYVIITDSWNFKPLLAEAVRGYRYFLRLAALECLCPLNNVRLLVDSEGQAAACSRHQLASPHLCADCVTRRQRQSGSLHQAERALSNYGTPEYDQKLRQAFAETEGVLVVNPLIAAMVGPFSSAVHVVPSGFDADRFPWPPAEAASCRFRAREAGVSALMRIPATRDVGLQPPEDGSSHGRTHAAGSNPAPRQVFFAGLVHEYMKGFHVLHAACEELWARRRDFELVATAAPPGQVDAFTRFVGWQSQADLPRRIREADMLVFPTIAEEALGRTAVEAMGVGRPVIASRIGGLPFTVADGATGLLFEPGNIGDLASKIEKLLDDPGLCECMGQAGRKRFEEHFTWDAIIEKHYRRLLSPVGAARPLTPDH